MKRITPYQYLAYTPCSIVAVTCALNHDKSIVDAEQPKDLPLLRDDGYMTLNAMNQYIRANLQVKKRIDYKRGQRPLLKDLQIDGKAIVCVFGHYVFVDKDVYYSFFDDDNDEVVAVWILK